MVGIVLKWHVAHVDHTNNVIQKFSVLGYLLVLVLVFWQKKNSIKTVEENFKTIALIVTIWNDDVTYRFFKHYYLTKRIRNKDKWKNSWDSSLCSEAEADQQKKTIVSQVIHVAAVAQVARPQDHGPHPSLGAADLLASWIAGASPGNACRKVEELLVD